MVNIFVLIVVAYLCCFIKWKLKPCYLHSSNTCCLSCYESYVMGLAFLSLFLPYLVFIAYYSKAQNLNVRAPLNGTSMIPLCMAAFCIESLHLPKHSVAATVLRERETHCSSSSYNVMAHGCGFGVM